MTDFFKHGNKVYSENLNDGILVGNSFDWTVNMSLPGDTSGVFPNTTTVVKAKVADCSITPNSNLSIGETITNNAGSSQVYRLTVYPNFNRFGGFTFVSLEGDGDVIITEVGASAPIRNNLDYSNLGDVVELKQLKEYDIVVTIPSGGEVTGLSFGFKSSSADVTASINQSNVTGLESDLSSLESGKADTVHTHSSTDVTEASALTHIGTSANATQSVVNGAVDEMVGSLDTSITNKVDTIYNEGPELSSNVWTGGNHLYLYRIGKLVVAFIPSGQLKYTSTGWKDMITLPEGYRPRINTPLAVINNSSETFNQWRTNNNVLQVYCATANTPAYTGCFGVWITADDYPSP